jgi:hypothetical protein
MLAFARRENTMKNVRRLYRISGLVGAIILPLVAVLATGIPEASAEPAICTVQGHGSPGYETFTLHVDHDGCGLPVAAAAECVISVPSGEPPYGDPYVYTAWVYGPNDYYGGETSKTASCGAFNVYFLTYGYNVYYGGKWHYTEIGEE